MQEGTPAADLAKKLFEAYDRFRLRDEYALLDKGLAAQRDGNPQGGHRRPRRGVSRPGSRSSTGAPRALPAYVAYGKALEPTDRSAALAARSCKALRLDDTGPAAAPIQSEIAYLEGEDLVAGGLVDTAPFERAIALDPSNARAQAEIDRQVALVETNRAKGWKLVAAVGILALLAIAGIFAIGGRRGRRGAHAG